MKEVKLNIKGHQTNIDGEKNDIEMVTEGKFYKKNGTYYIVYDESELTGMEGSTTTLKIEGDKVSMKRFGNNTSSLTFEQGKKHTSTYDTLYGGMSIKVITRNVDVDISDVGKGSIDISYRLDISGVVESTNELSIEMN